MFTTDGYVEAVAADQMLDVSTLEGWRATPSTLNVTIRTRSGLLTIPWQAEAPAIGARVRLTVEMASQRQEQ